MTEQLYNAIEKRFSVSKAEITDEQRSELQSFLKSSDNSSLLIEPSNNSSNGLRIKCTTKLETVSKESLLFIKVDNAKDDSNETVIDEAKALKHLRNRLSQTTSVHSSVINVLSELKKYIKYSNIMNSLKNERSLLLKKVAEWAEDMVVPEEFDQYSIVEKIGILKAREGKLKAVVKVSDSFFQDIEGYIEQKKSMEQLVRELNSQSSSLFRDWCEASKNIKLDSRKQCIEIDTSTQIPRVTFDPRLVVLTKDCRSLRCYGFVLPPEIVESEEDMKKYGFIARELREIVNFYCTIGDQILLSQRPMLIDSAKAFTSLLESKDKISWDKEPLKLRSWMDELKDFSRSFSTENRALRRRHHNILQIMTTFFDIPPGKWRTSLNEIRTIIHDIDTKYSNTNPWKKHWDHQLYKVLDYHFSEALIKSENWLGFTSNNSLQMGQTSVETLKIDLCFESGCVCFRPSFEEIKAKIFVRIKKFLSIPMSFQGIVECSNNYDSMFNAIFLRSFTAFPVLYVKANDIIDELRSVRMQFIEWTSIYYILESYGSSNSSLSSVLQLDSLHDYKNNLMTVKAKSQKFNKEFVENELKCKNSNIVINLIPIKIFVEWLYVEIDKLIVRSLKLETEAIAKALQIQLQDIVNQLSECPKNIDELLRVERLANTEITGFQSEIMAKYREFEERYAFLMKWSAKSTPNFGNIVSEYEEFDRIFETRHSIIDSFKELMKSKLENRVENLKIEIQHFSEKWIKSSASNKNDKQFVSELKLECESVNQDFDEINKTCEYFHFKRPDSFSTFEALKKEIEEVDVKLNLFYSFEAGFSNFMEMEWIVSRNKLSVIENYLSHWEEDNPNCGSIMTDKIKEWREFLSLLKLCRGECFVKSHWDEFLALLNLSNDTTYDSLKLEHLVSKKELIFSNRESIKELNARSVGEMSVRETFNELDSFAASTVFELYDYKTSTGNTVKLIKSWRTVMNQISESVLSLQSLKQSEFFSSEFAEKRVQWEERLSSLDTIVSLLNSVQRKWTYLEPIYAKNETQAFTDNSFPSASHNFQELTKTIASDTHIVRLLRISGLEPKLRDIDSVFNSCQKKLNVFMELSRNRFPRFYFLADDELLLILAGKADISQTGLLKKLFNNSISKLHVNGNSVYAIESPEGEVVKLNKQILIESNEGAASVEMWLRNLEIEVKSSLKYLLFNTLKTGFSFESAQLDLPSQILSLLHFITFTTRTEEAITRNRLSDLQAELKKQLEVYTKKELTNEDNILKIKIKSLILDFIHFLSVVDEVLQQNVDNIESWFWQKHLRYYSDIRKETVEVRMGNSASSYSFEYLGTYGASKLVHTPLTDKCYLICMQAMAMGLGGNPYGPAGTGKTETIKALGQQLGRQVLVFNCDEAIDIKSILRILIGLIKCGFWGCFDEFNRLQIDVLSSLSSHIQTIQNALKMSSKSVALVDEDIEINSNCGIFVTLNPVGKQYKGRNRLPDNLKSLFLPISMTIPDSAIISKVLLLAEGFDPLSTKTIGDKITTWFELCKFSMSQQKHYDWGLRAVKSCLLSSGRTLKMNPNTNDILAVIIALRKQIKSKLVYEDEQKFEELIRDVFGDKLVLESLENIADISRSQVAEVYEKNNLVADEIQISKLLELDEQLKSRLGVVILGESGVGKSTLWKTLIDIKREIENVSIIPIVINPKSVSRTQLFGFVDEDTREWIDGIFTCKAREVARDDSNNLFWLVFDGDIDPEWVEALNSVLDDNKVLTLPSGERIDFDSQKVNIIFETISLKFASPATISRLGVVSVGNVKAQHLIKSKLKEWSINQPSDSIMKLISGIKSDLLISHTRTLLSRMKFALNNNKDLNNVLNNKSLLKTVEPHKLGNLVITSSLSSVIDLISSLADESLVLVGDSGVGKHTILTETILKSGVVVHINCYPQITARDVTQKLREVCVVVHLGSQKVLKTNNGSKLIIYIRHLELIEADKWKSKYLLAFLTNLITYKGFYDDETLEWTSVDNFQVVGTCVSIEYLDSKLLSQLHIVHVELPPLDELKRIFEMCCPETAKWKSSFASCFSKLVKTLQDSNLNYDFLRIAMKIIHCSCRHSEVNDEVLTQHSMRSLKYKIGNKTHLEKLMLSSYGVKCTDDELYFSETFGSKLTKRKAEEFRTFFKKAFSLWVNETEICMKNVGLINECVELFMEVANFLSDAEEGIKGLILSSFSGTGRKLATKIISLFYGYDAVWIPKNALSEKQLISDLNSLLQTDENESNRKIVILVDTIHFNLIPYLKSKIYNLLFLKFNNVTVRVVVTVNDITDVDYLMWNRVCHIYKVSHWSEESQTQISKMITDTEESENFFNLFPEMFKVSAKFKNDSRRYLAFVDTFSKLMSSKTLYLQERRTHLTNGVSKLDEASSEVEKLKEEAKQQQTVLAAKRKEADDALTLITTSMQNSEEQKVELEDIKARTEKETAKLKIRKAEIDAELKEIEPTLLAAKAAVGGIKPESLAEIRSLRAPPEVIRDILEGVLRLMGVNDTSWVSMKSFLSRRGVKEEIMNFDARKITPEMRTKVETLMKTKADSFEEQQAKRASAAAAPLAIWLKANVTYSKVLHKIKPLEEEQNKLEAGLRSAVNRMKSLTGELQGVEIEVGNLRNRLNQVTVEAAEIEVNLKQTTRTLSKSESLIGELSDEFVRWKHQLSDLNNDFKALPLQCLVSAAYLVLAGIESSSEQRVKIFESCCQKAGLKDFNLLRFLNCTSDEDLFISTQSSLLTAAVIDPTRKFISNISNAEIVDLNKHDWQRTLELSLRFGRAVVIDGFIKMNLQLLSLLKHEVYGTEGSRQWIFLGDKRVDYNQNFRMFLLATDSFSEINNNTMINLVNLAPSNSNTAEMLLSIIIKIRRPELEQKKIEIEKNCRDMESKMKSLEEELLCKLSSSSGNILNNDELIKSLKVIKTSTNEIETSLKQSATIASDLNKERAQYLQLAQFASNVYFEVRELFHLNHMYRIGIQEYVELFTDCLKSNTDITHGKVLQSVYNYVSQGLFPEDKMALKRFLEARHSENLTLTNPSLSSFIQNLNSKDRCKLALVVTATGSDPSAEIREIITSMNIKDSCLISMGSDYIEKAENTLTGDQPPFVCLTNLHFVISWLSKLSTILMNLSDKKSTKFVVLVSECHEEFPVSLLEVCSKFVYESVPGLKAQVNSLNVDSALRSIPEFKKVAFFHAICSERRHFVPFGWTKSYEFGFNDFKSALHIIENVKKTNNRRWQLNFISGLLQNVIYGGKLDTKVDSIILRSLIKQWFSNFELNIDFDLKAKNETSVLGLPANINLWKSCLLEDKLKKKVQILEKAANIEITKEELKVLQELWRKSRLNETMETKSFSMSNSSPITDFLASECKKVNALISMIDSDLKSIKDDTLASLANNETLDSWLSLFPTGSENADKFIDKLAEIARELRKKVNSTELGSFNLSHLLSVSSFMNAIRQQAARVMTADINSLTIHCSWTKHNPQLNQAFMVTLTGLVIEGARFDDKFLVDCSENSDLQTAMPQLNLYFISKENNLLLDAETVALPVYGSNTRDNALFWFDVPCKSGSQEHWIQAAVALIIK